jgi:hypothetical protein
LGDYIDKKLALECGPALRDRTPKRFAPATFCGRSPGKYLASCPSRIGPIGGASFPLAAFLEAIGNREQGIRNRELGIRKNSIAA